ncbi:hypothetical protein GCM10023259_049680 [Thermocatellispora tengchongensis]
MYLLAWRRSAGQWECLVTWVDTTRTESGAIHQKRVEWVPDDELKTMRAEKLRRRYKAVPRFEQ